MTGSSAGLPPSSAGAEPAARTPGGQGAGAAGSAEGATTTDGAATTHAAAQSYRSSCAAVPESGYDEDAGASVALAAAPLSASGAAAEGGPVSSAAPRTDEGVDESDEEEDDEGEEAKPPLPEALGQRWRSLRSSVLAAVRASQPRPAGEGRGEGSTRELV